MEIRIRELEYLGEALPFFLAKRAILPFQKALEDPVELAHSAPAPPPQPLENGVRPHFIRRHR
jgi:hypothetical protein